ncbi:hypothetical protein C5S39_01940 [Candidatus Methanophagaceae archaeon]|nr:hypothetical protein C5S39_01940 [Methanophagales archaeon]
MKKIIAGLVAIALVAVSIGVAAYAFANTSTSEPEGGSSYSIGGVKGMGEGYHNMPEEYVLNTTLPSVPAKLMVYRVVEPNVTREEVASLAERLGMDGSVKEESYRFVVTDGQYDLHVGKSVHNHIYYEDTSRWRKRNDKDEPENLPSDEEAIAIVMEFLNDTGLMPEDAVPHKVEHSTSKVMVSFATDETNNLPAIAGFRMSVEVGGNGNIIRVTKDWSEYEPYKESSVITPEEAFEELNKSGITTGLRNVTTATINEVCFGYHYYTDYEKEQRFLKPIYKFKGVAKGKIDGHTETKPFSTLIYALSDDYPIPPAKKYVLNTTLPSVPDKLMVYKTAEPKVSKADVASLAEQVGLNGSIKEVSDGFMVTYGQYYLKVNNISGSILYTDIGNGECQNIRFSTGGGITCDVSPRSGHEVLTMLFLTPGLGTCHSTSHPSSDDEAIEITREFLDDTGLMPEDAILNGVEHSKNGGMNVWFRREINGLPVTGDGSEIGVGVCDYQNIAGVFKVWKEYESHEEFSIITPEVALEEFKTDGEDAGRVNARGVVTINNVYLGYYSKPAGEEQAYLQPVYVFEGVTKGSGGTMRFEQYIPAITELGGIEFGE